MQSKTLCFNRTLFRKNLTRFWPLWAVPSFVGALFPLAMLTQLLRYGVEGLFGRSDSYALEFTGIYYDVVSYALPSSPCATPFWWRWPCGATCSTTAAPD